VNRVEASTAQALSHRLAAEQSERRLPSLVAGVVRDGELAWFDACGTLDGRPGGPAPDAGTQYRLGSISKTFVGVEIMRLRDEGRLEIGDSVGAHVPDLDFGQVTIAQLLTHTSGLQAETDGPWWERVPGEPWDALAASTPQLRFTPGTRFHYSNVGYAVLGEVIARLRGEPWHAAVQAGILDPLGMNRTTLRPEPPAAAGLAVHPFADTLQLEPEHDAVALAPAGQLWSTATDLARWAAFLGGDTADVLRSETLDEMLHPVAINDVPDVAWAGAHALGWQVWNVEGRRFAGHGGSMPGFLAVLRVDLTSGDGVVLLTNATSGLGTATTDLLNTFAELEPHPPEPWSADATQADAVELTGSWFWGTTPFTLALQPDGGLRLGTPGEGRGARFARSDDGWIGLEGYYAGEPLTVRRDADGRPVQLDLASFVFSRTPYNPAAEVPGGVDPDGWR
jgi:CubicO group peptidase (beta-lactamase class C family)